MSAEEVATAEAVAAPAATEDNTAAAPTTNGDTKKPPREREERKRDETPVEELYDLTQPIPRVDRPNKDEHDKQLQALTDSIDALKADRQKVQEKIDAAMTDPTAKSSQNDNRAKLNAFKQQKFALIEEKKAMRNEMDQARATTDKLIKDKKDVRSNVKFSTIEEIEKEIKKLKVTQETTTMKLSDEKKLIKEMDGLQASKKFVAEIKSKDTAMDDVKEKRKTIQQNIGAKDKEIDAVSKDMDEIGAILKEHSEKDNKKRDAIQGLFQERDVFKVSMNSLIKEKDAARNTFREANNAWYNYQRAVRVQKNMQWEAEKKSHDEERAAAKAAFDAEEAKKIPYEEEQTLCDYLADYLERTYLGVTKEVVKEEVAVAEIKDDPFAGFMAVNKKDVQAEEFFGKGKGKKKRVRAAKPATAGPFTLSVDSFEQFGLLQLTPPVSVNQVEGSVKELRAKKEWYSQQPRGSVPTATEIRKANEKKVRQSDEKAAKPVVVVKGKFSLSQDDFAPLGAGGAAASSLISSWGQPKAAAPEMIAEPEPAL